MKRILLLNAECVQTVCMAHSLRKQGYYVIGFCSQKLSSGYTTRWLSEKYKSPDILSHTDEFFLFITRYLSSNKVDIIIPMADDSADFLSRNKEIFERDYHVLCAIPSYGTFQVANNKQLLMELCEKHNIPHPRTRAMDVDDITAIVNYVGFPLMIKPNLSQGAKGIMKVSNLQELTEKYPLVHEQFGPCTLQQYINQPPYYYNVMLYRDRNGNMDNYTIIKIRRYFPLKGGSSCYSETINHPSLLKQCKDILDKLSWVGFADFDVLEEASSGELKIIEINPRVPSSLQASYAAGVDFGKIIIEDLCNKLVLKSDYKVGCQVRWMGLDVMWFLFSKDRFRFKPSWFKIWGKDVSYHDGSLKDPLPMLAGIIAGIVKYMNPSFRRAKLKS